ncbi:hypothetical protein [Leptotrichia sp. OH3620_COT-345]|nr:hypothetical protein [Leptotrichia sp. OH3620_COT-345]
MDEKAINLINRICELTKGNDGKMFIYARNKIWIYQLYKNVF